MMNNFASLSAENDMHNLATISAEEAYLAPLDLAPAPRTPRKLNISKLVLHNMTQPFEKRISRATLEAKRQFARERGNLIALWAKIHAECEPARRALRQQEEAVENL